MELGLVGKPNVGKSTFFAAATETDIDIANYPFTTIEPNRGVAYVRTECPHDAVADACDPRHGRCVDGTRLVPVEVVDVAGLVPGAHEGKGLGNRFLDDLREAEGLVHVVDATGATDDEGNPVDPGTHDPLDDVDFLVDEIDRWIAGIVSRGWDKIERQAEQTGGDVLDALAERLTGLGLTEADVQRAAREQDPADDRLAFASAVRRIGKPILVAANKVDRADDDQVTRLADAVEHLVPCAAEPELALRRAARAGAVDYTPGDASFEIVDRDALSDDQLDALEFVREQVLDRFGSTGVQEALESAVFDLLDRIVVYPVDDAANYADAQGNVLPDAFLVPRGTTAEEMAWAVHSDLGEGFIRAVDAATDRTIGADHELEDGDVVRIVADR